MTTLAAILKVSVALESLGATASVTWTIVWVVTVIVISIACIAF